MKSRLQEISNISGFLITSLIVILFAGYFVVTGDKEATHIAINQHHNSFFDTFFTYATYLGDGVVAPILVLIFGIIYFKKYRFSTFTIGFGTLILVGAFSQLLKRMVFEEALRPSAFIGADKLYLIPDLEIHTVHSFPSGHTTAAFGLAAFIAFMFFQKNRLMQIVMVILASLTGFSRVYLSQHFLEDITVGAALGLFSFLLIALVIPRRKSI